jgi:hypothetical protein
LRQELPSENLSRHHFRKSKFQRSTKEKLLNKKDAKDHGEKYSVGVFDQFACTDSKSIQ